MSAVVPPVARPRSIHPAPFLAAAVAFAVYAITAARGITWWDGGSYPLAAVTLGIPGAPGSLLLTILGWIVAGIPIVEPVVFRLNLFAGLLAATLVGLVTGLGARLATPEGREPGLLENVAGAVAGLTLGLGVTLWTYATQFTPYVLTALWTALLLVTALRWWRRSDPAKGRVLLFLLFLLLGLDFSIHRTNLLLLPALILWVVLRTPSSGSWVRDALAVGGGFLAGLTFHLLLIPMAALKPWYMVEDTRTLQAWWDYVTVGRSGGGFLIDLFPRRADFFSVQLADVLRFLKRNLAPAWYLPAVLAGIGWVSILRHHPRRALGLMAYFLCAGLGAVLYFNVPPSYFRSMDRHYLPSLVVVAPWIAVGAAVLLRAIARAPAGRVLAAGAASALFAIPFLAWRTNFEACDLSRWRFAECYARDLLEPLPERAILFTNGDNDSFPLWCVQHIMGIRRDVLVVNLSLANTGLCLEQLRDRDPSLARLLETEPMQPVLEARSEGMTVSTAVDRGAELGLPHGHAAPDSVRFTVKAPIYGEDRVVLDLLRITRWGRPLFLATTVTRDHVPWLWPYTRLDGLAFRVIPTDDPSVWDVDHFRTQLRERVRFAGLARETRRPDDVTSGLWRNYVAAYIQLAMAQIQRRDGAGALETLRVLEEVVDPLHLGLSAAEWEPIRNSIQSGAKSVAPR